MANDLQYTFAKMFVRAYTGHCPRNLFQKFGYLSIKIKFLSEISTGLSHISWTKLN